MVQNITALRAPLPDDELLASWRRHMRAANLSPNTVFSYERHVGYLRTWLAQPEHGGPRPLTSTSSDDLVRWLAETVERTSGSTGAAYFRMARPFFRWLLAEGEIGRDPFDGVPQPKPEDAPPRILTLDELRALVGACQGRAFDDVRDHALIRLLVDVGPRLGGLAGLTVADLDLDGQTAVVTSKGKRLTIPYGVATAGALDRYLRARRRHRRAALPALWLGKQGGLTRSGIQQVVQRRAAKAGLGMLNPHALRHAFAHHYLLSGGQESDLMALAGWESPAMTRVYARSTRSERAREAHKTHGLGDRL